MTHNLEFANRLKKIMDHYELSAAAFAERIQVQPSSISHLLSGRNRPSLDFVLKVLEEFPAIELYWLLNGKGTFPKDNDLSAYQLKKTMPSEQENSSKEIDQITIFYSDGTFKNYLPNAKKNPE